MFSIFASHRLLAVKADQAKAETFLQELGFKHLSLKVSDEEIIKFNYVTYDPTKLEEYLGNPKPSDNPRRVEYDYGKNGSLVVWTKIRTVILKNSGIESLRVKPTETHVPKEIEKISPNTPGSKENDDSHVPIVHVTPALDKEYSVVSKVNSPMARLLFMKHLWTHFNAHKFNGQMELPKFRLLKMQDANSMRLRGRWWSTKRLLEVSPRLFNATENFFLEVFLHEMCHEAVSEIDKINETVNKGHGPNWARWMKHVGLNPLRFDPNDNSVYMNDKEKAAHEELKQKNLALKEIRQSKAQELGVSQMMPWDNVPATVIRNGEAFTGLLICAEKKKLQGRQIWAFITDAQFADMIGSNVFSWMRVTASEVYEYKGDKSHFFNDDWQYIRRKVKEFVESK